MAQKHRLKLRKVAQKAVLVNNSEKQDKSNRDSRGINKN